MTIRETGALLRARKASCVELVQQALADLKRHTGLHAMITITEDQALAEARQRDEELAAGRDRGPLHGIPTAHKDVFYTRGIPTTGGSLLFRDFVPSYDATVVDRLAQAGAVSLGKANLHELAYGATSKNPHYGFVLNPRNTDHVPGGSSGGSAAVVTAGIVPFSLGTDTAGSIRMPASYCGIAGLKPTYGRVSRYGMLPLAFSLDHAGPLAATADDCALVMNAIAGSDPHDPSCSTEPAPDFTTAHVSPKQLRVGVPRDFFFEHVQPDVAAAVERKIAELAGMGAAVSEIQLPDMQEITTVARIVQMSESAALYATQTDPSLFGEDVWALIEQGRMLRAHEYVNAQRLRTVFRRAFNRIWEQVDVLVTPTTPITAPGLNQTTVRIGNYEEKTRWASLRFCRALNFLGEPALSIPCGTDGKGLPIGLQLIGPPFDEPSLLKIGQWIEGS